MPRYTLHCFPESGNSYKIALMLTLIGEPYDSVWTDFFSGVTRTAEWRSTVNEMGEMPVLVEDGKQFAQSGVILLRLAAHHRKFDGQDDGEKSEILRWLLWDNHKLTSYMATYRFLRSFADDPAPAVQEFLRIRLDNILGIVDQRVKTRDFILGSRPTVADISMCGYLFYPPEETGYDFPAQFPHVAAWLTRISQLPRWRAPYDLLPGKRYSRK